MSNPMPGPSSSAYSPKKKRPKNSPLRINEKTIARNVYKFVSETMDGWPYAMEIVEKTAEIMGVSVSTIRRVITEHRDTGKVSSPVLQVPRLSAVNQLDDFVLTGIRRKIHQFYFDKEIPTVKKMLAAVNNDEDLPTFKTATFLKVLKKLNFTYCKRSRKSILLDRPDLMIWRRKYLLKMADYRREDRIYYLDETWVNEGHSVSSVWVDNDIETSRQAFMRGLSTGLKNPNKGRRLIVTHIGSDDGFLEGGEWVFEAKKSDGDYHGEMDAHNFEKWSEALSHMDIRACSRYTQFGGFSTPIELVMKHSNFSIRAAPQNDIALLRTQKALTFSHTCHAVDLPNANMRPPFEDVWVTSWGAERRDGMFETGRRTLQAHHVNVMDHEECNNITLRFGVEVKEDFMCTYQTGRRAPCTRDTGAPAVSDGVLWGLASWGLRKKCGTERFPAMFSYLGAESNIKFISYAMSRLMSDMRESPFLDRKPVKAVLTTPQTMAFY